MPRGAGRDQFVRPAGPDSTRRADRSRSSRVADSGRLRRQKSADRARRTSSTCVFEQTDSEPDAVWLEKRMTTRWTRKDLLGLRELSAGGNQFHSRNGRRVQTSRHARDQEGAGAARQDAGQFLRRTEHAHAHFVRAGGVSRLSADVINISASTSSLTKGETLKDTARNLEAFHADILVLRHSSAGAPQFLASRLQCERDQRRRRRARASDPGAARSLHDSREAGKIAGLHVAIIGDILFSRVARSNIFGLTKLGARVTLVGPSTLVPREFEKLGVTVSHKIDDVLADADVVNLLRIQHERQRKEYFPGIGEYTDAVRPNQRARETAEAGLPDHASGPDQSRRRDRQRSRRRRAKRHSRSSHQRSRRPHGRSLSLRRNRDVMNDDHSQRPHHRSGEQAR